MGWKKEKNGMKGVVAIHSMKGMPILFLYIILYKYIKNLKFVKFFQVGDSYWTDFRDLFFKSFPYVCNQWEKSSFFNYCINKLRILLQIKDFVSNIFCLNNLNSGKKFCRFTHYKSFIYFYIGLCGRTHWVGTGNGVVGWVDTIFHSKIPFRVFLAFSHIVLIAPAALNAAG
jgi:hypothetical protein